MAIRAGFYIAFILYVLSLPGSAEEWSVKVDDSGEASLVWQLKGGRRLGFFQYFLQADQLAAEVVAGFKSSHPALWESAIKSSGNMHNPKVTPLRVKFSGVLLKTPTLKKLDHIARDSGYTIAGASHGKFHLIKKDQSVRVYAGVWLDLKKLDQD